MWLSRFAVHGNVTVYPYIYAGKSLESFYYNVMLKHINVIVKNKKNWTISREKV